MLSSWEQVRSWITNGDVVRFNIQRGEKASSQSNDNIFVFNPDRSLEENMERARKALDLNTDGCYIVGWTSDKAATGAIRQYICYSGIGAAPGYSMPAPAPMGATEREQLIQDTIERVNAQWEKKMFEKERAEFKEEKKAYEAEKQSVIGVLVQQVAPYIAQLAGLRQAPRVAGLDAEQPVTAQPINAQQPAEEEVEIFTDEESEKLTQLMARFKAVEPQYMELIEAVVKMAEAGDSTYTMAKGFLLK